jgi:hypothetical protein
LHNRRGIHQENQKKNFQTLAQSHCYCDILFLFNFQNKLWWYCDIFLILIFKLCLVLRKWLRLHSILVLSILSHFEIDLM